MIKHVVLDVDSADHLALGCLSFVNVIVHAPPLRKHSSFSCSDDCLFSKTPLICSLVSSGSDVYVLREIHLYLSDVYYQKLPLFAHILREILAFLSDVYSYNFHIITIVLFFFLRKMCEIEDCLRYFL